MSLPVYLTSTEVKLTVDLTDGAGNAINANTAQYRVRNQDDVELVALTAVPDFIAGDPQAVITIPAIKNVVGGENTREIRSVELICVTDDFTVSINKSYAIELSTPLVTGVNSFQSYDQALLTALDMPKTDAWDSASEDEKVAALIDARRHIIQLNFNLLNSNVNFGQDSLQYVPEGSYESSYVARNSLFIFNGNLEILKADQFVKLPDRFKKSLRLAQVAEADHILGGNTMDSKRQSGIVEERIGESAQKYRDTKPIELPVCRRALSYLSYYVSFAKRVGRAG